MVDHGTSEQSSFEQDLRPDPAAQGQAALLLLESLIHSLLDNGSLTKAQAIVAIESALEVKEDSAAAEKEPTAVRVKSIALLTAMRNSIRAHAGRDEQVAADSSDDEADPAGD